MQTVERRPTKVYYSSKFKISLEKSGAYFYFGMLLQENTI